MINSSISIEKIDVIYLNFSLLNEKLMKLYKNVVGSIYKKMVNEELNWNIVKASFQRERNLF